MPKAIVELTRSGAYDVVAIRPVPIAIGRDWVLPPLPEGLYAFSKGDGLTKSPTCVGFRLAKDNSGTDCTPVLVAADYLRELGWEVELPRWMQPGN